MPARRALRVFLFVLVAAALVFVGLVIGVSGEADDRGSKPTRQSSRPAAKSAPTANGGTVDVSYRGASGDDADAARLVRTSKLGEQAATALVDSIELPKDVTVVFGGAPDGPFYDPEDRSIQYPWAFVTETRRLLKASGYEPDALDDATVDATRFILQHELGHALVDVLQLPVLGREEDAADGFAAFTAVELADDGNLVIAATDLFAAFDDEAGHTIEDSDFFDSHSLDRQRFFGISCLVYGSDVTKYAGVVDGIGFDAERLDECPAEWQQVRDGWYDVLGPYLRD